MIRTAIARAVLRDDLPRERARASLEQILDGDATPAQIGALAVALRMKGEAPEEIASMAEAMRERVPPIRTKRAPLLDTCGTGGDNAGTFNMSNNMTSVGQSAAGIMVAAQNSGMASLIQQGITSPAATGTCSYIDNLKVKRQP